jgi:hypothetical protein
VPNPDEDDDDEVPVLVAVVFWVALPPARLKFQKPLDWGDGSVIQRFHTDTIGAMENHRKHDQNRLNSP